jgi:hypothetical protein
MACPLVADGEDTSRLEDIYEHIEEALVDN